jgi:hypothetical protein
MGILQMCWNLVLLKSGYMLLYVESSIMRADYRVVSVWCKGFCYGTIFFACKDMVLSCFGSEEVLLLMNLLACCVLLHHSLLLGYYDGSLGL